jgi:prolyl 4-hydroxylase
MVLFSEPNFTPSTVWSHGVEHLDPAIRNSQKALLARDTVVQCIEQRARALQGWRKNLFIERLWSQKYDTPGGHYRHHYDWNAASATGGRVSSFMVYLEANCTGGGTNFPRLKRPEGEWCRFVECEGEGEEKRERLEGTTFKPIRGNAVFWENLRSDGSGYRESWHAGLPVTEGRKVGLNIWSWVQGE